MTSTNDERREVAARLRATKAECDNRDYPWMVEDLMQALGFETYEDGYEGIFDRLADLIDPQERTCENVSEKDFEFACSNCHAYTDSPNSYRVEIGYKSGLHNNLNYCPYCGARVTDGGDSR